jgi:hypothetical protein
MLLVMGLGLRFCVFFLLALPIVGSALLIVAFCLDLGPFFSFLLFACSVFSLYLIVYNDSSLYKFDLGCS